MKKLNPNVDLTLVEKAGWWYRRGLHDADFNLVRESHDSDCYHLADFAMPADQFIVVDVGAGIGTFSRLAADRGGSRANVISIEANPLNIPALKKNTTHRCRVVEAAMTYEGGDVGLLDSLYVGTDASGGSVVHPMPIISAYAGDQYIPRARPLEKVTIEGIIQRFSLPRIDMLKLDCEGSEHSILRGVKSETIPWIRVICGEYHGGRERWERLVADVFAPKGWRHVSWNHHDHMGMFWLASPGVMDNELANVIALDNDYGSPVPAYRTEPFGPDMMISRDRGIAWQIDRSRSISYGQVYFDAYVERRTNDKAESIIACRKQLVDKYEVNVIDIGVGSLHFMDSCDRCVSGYDVNQVAVQELKRRGRFLDPYAERLPENCGGVTLWDVLEHMPNPSRLLNRIPVGWHVFTSLPIFDNLNAVRLSKHFKPDEHYWYFTNDGLKAYMADHGFECIESDDRETKAGRESIRSYVFKRIERRSITSPTFRANKLSSSWTESTGSSIAQPAANERIYSPDDFGGTQSVIQLIVPAGIGDISWVYSKVKHLRALSGREIILYCPGGDAPRRGGDFIQLLPEVRWGGYYGIVTSWQVISQSLPAKWPEKIGTVEMFCHPFVQPLAVNLHLEMGKRLSDWLPWCPTDYHYPLAIPQQQVEEAWRMMSVLEGRAPIAVYTSNREKDYIRLGGWNVMDEPSWMKLLHGVAETPECEGCGFVLIGAEYDGDKTNGIADSLEKSGYSVVRVINKPLGVALECLKRCKYCFSFPSGIGILANVLRVPGIMFLPWILSDMHNMYADPADTGRQSYKTWITPDPEQVLAWFRRIGIVQAGISRIG